MANRGHGVDISTPNPSSTPITHGFFQGNACGSQCKTHAEQAFPTYQSHRATDLQTLSLLSICILLLWQMHQTRELAGKNKAAFLPLVTQKQMCLSKFHQGKLEIKHRGLQKKKRRKNRNEQYLNILRVEGKEDTRKRHSSCSYSCWTCSDGV